MMSERASDHYTPESHFSLESRSHDFPWNPESQPHGTRLPSPWRIIRSCLNRYTKGYDLTGYFFLPMLFQRNWNGKKETEPPMIASVRFWRAILETLPDMPELDDLAVRLRHEPPQSRKRHMPWNVPLSPNEEAHVRAMMADPPTPYVASVVAYHRHDALASSAMDGNDGGHGMIPEPSYVQDLNGDALDALNVAEAACSLAPIFGPVRLRYRTDQSANPSDADVVEFIDDDGAVVGRIENFEPTP